MSDESIKMRTSERTVAAAAVHAAMGGEKVIHGVCRIGLQQAGSDVSLNGVSVHTTLVVGAMIGETLGTDVPDGFEVVDCDVFIVPRRRVRVAKCGSADELLATGYGEI